MNRRSFMRSILAAGVAPCVVTTAGLLMPIRSRIEVLPSWVWVPGLGTFSTIADAYACIAKHEFRHPPDCDGTIWVRPRRHIISQSLVV